MAGSGERWIDSLRFSSLFCHPPPDDQQRKDQIAAYVEYIGQFTSEQFADDIAELIRNRHPSKEVLLFDDVLVHHHPEHGHAVILPIISCIIDGTLVYDKTSPPFASFISLICPKSESEYSEQWALACGEILCILTHYNRPMYKSERQYCDTERSSGESHTMTNDSADGECSHNSFMQQEKKPIRPLSPWITDILLAAPLGIRSDYFRWCSGVMGTAMSMRAGVAADTAAALLFRILSQPALLFPPLREVDGVDVQHEPLGGYISPHKKQIEAPAAEATTEATAQGIASLLCDHGPEVEWRICTIWEAAYGLIPLNSSAVDLPEIVVATPLQPPILSWNLYIPLLKVLEYLPRGSPSEACLMKIFIATVEAILQRTFPSEPISDQNRKTRFLYGSGSTSKNLAVAELRTMVHSLFLELGASIELASCLLFIVLTVCVSHEAEFNRSKKARGKANCSAEEIVEGLQAISESQKETKNRKTKNEASLHLGLAWGKAGTKLHYSL